ncbi:MAG: hypothetical protein D6762_06585 [Candidatus Neomarinimicrobiota bacterium]|nr:MAG: hypothetical protein D6762_06585 [Candidatus Neomarinimicrobiota bacterium]
MDAGDALFESSALPDYKKKASLYKARKMLEAYQTLGYAAVNIGQYDLAAGTKFLRELADSSAVPLVCANLVDDQTNEPLFNPYVVVEQNGFRVGILGLLSRLPSHLPGVQLKDMILTGKDLIHQLQAETDLIVVLANVDSRKNRDLQEQFEGANYIFVSRGSLRSQPGQKQPEGGPYLYSSSIQGKYLSEVHLEIADLDSPIVDVTSYETTLKNVKDRFENLQKKDPGKPLEEIYANKPNVLRLISNYRQQKEIAEKALAHVVNRSRFKLVPLNRKIKDDPTMLAYIDRVLARADSLTGKPPVQVSRRKTPRPAPSPKPTR